MCGRNNEEIRICDETCGNHVRTLIGWRNVLADIDGKRDEVIAEADMRISRLEAQDM